MSRNKEYQRLLNSKRWKQLREWKLSRNPLCELCEQQGYITSAQDIHHKIPVESAKTEQEMERLCYDPANLMSLCVAHHIKVHQDERSHSAEARKKRNEDRLQQWISTRKGKPKR